MVDASKSVLCIAKKKKKTEIKALFLGIIILDILPPFSMSQQISDYGRNPGILFGASTLIPVNARPDWPTSCPVDILNQRYPVLRSIKVA